MTPLKIINICFLQTFLLLCSCWFYSIGGAGKEGIGWGKWARRYIGAFFISWSVWIGFILTQQWNWWLLTFFPLCSITMHIGYGSDKFWIKVLKRFSVCAASLVCSAVLVITLGKNAVFLLPVDVMLGIASIYLGVRNPTQASGEEFQVCLLLWSCKMFYPYV